MILSIDKLIFCSILIIDRDFHFNFNLELNIVTETSILSWVHNEPTEQVKYGSLLGLLVRI